jgi:hypothetical protein
MNHRLPNGNISKRPFPREMVFDIVCTLFLGAVALACIFVR